MKTKAPECAEEMIEKDAQRLLYRKVRIRVIKTNELYKETCNEELFEPI